MKIKQRYFKHNAGFTMIELVITIAVLSFGIIGVYGAFSPIIMLNYNISARAGAAYLAQEGVEIVRNIRDNNVIKIKNGQRILWSDGLLQCSLGCQADYKTATLAEAFESKLKAYDQQSYLQLDADGFYSYSQGTATKFKRKITILQLPGGDAVKITVSVMWDYAGKPFNFETEDYLYHWK